MSWSTLSSIFLLLRLFRLRACTLDNVLPYVLDPMSRNVSHVACFGIRRYSCEEAAIFHYILVAKSPSNIRSLLNHSAISVMVIHPLPCNPRRSLLSLRSLRPYSRSESSPLASNATTYSLQSLFENNGKGEGRESSRIDLSPQ